VRLRAALAALAAAALLPGALASAAYEEVTVPDGGTLAGVVRLAGPPPRLDPLPVNKNRELCGDQKPSEALVLGQDGAVRGSVIMLEGITRGKKSSHDVLLDNHKCLFVAHVSAAMVGDRSRVRNSDPVLHNTHGFLGRPTVFNLALPTKDQVIDITKRLTRPGVVRVVCDAHPHMFAWLIVHDSPYFAVTDEKGAYRIDGIPPGAYKVTMWHEGFRPKGTDKDGRPLYDEPHTVSRDVTIAPKATAALDFELK
jgi:Carboxypeptidase regulatory-like domain